MDHGTFEWLRRMEEKMDFLVAYVNEQLQKETKEKPKQPEAK